MLLNTQARSIVVGRLRKQDAFDSALLETWSTQLLPRLWKHLLRLGLDYASHSDSLEQLFRMLRCKERLSKQGGAMLLHAFSACPVQWPMVQKLFLFDWQETLPFLAVQELALVVDLRLPLSLDR